MEQSTTILLGFTLVLTILVCYLFVLCRIFLKFMREVNEGIKMRDRMRISDYEHNRLQIHKLYMKISKLENKILGIPTINK
tara:strand:+ start:417 stop:659 length:243 start_codon:yes stop_codon:yes gene_type:complete